MRDGRREQQGDVDAAVRRAADQRIRAEALRLLDRVRPGDDDDWRIESLDPEVTAERIESEAAPRDDDPAPLDPTRSDDER